MSITVIRTIILYVMVIVVIRLMGKRQIGQLQPFELVVILMMSEMASIPAQSIGIPLFSGVIPILILLLAGVLLSYISLKSEKARIILCGRPTILIEHGQLLEDELRRTNYNLTDLLEELRIKNVPNLADVDFAILETNGQLSVIPKVLKRPATPEDLNLSPKYEGLPLPVILDGKLNVKNMEKAQVDLKWLRAELNKQKITNESQVLFASVDASKTLFAQTKQV